MFLNFVDVDLAVEIIDNSIQQVIPYYRFYALLKNSLWKSSFYYNRGLVLILCLYLKSLFNVNNRYIVFQNKLVRVNENNTFNSRNR